MRIESITIPLIRQVIARPWLADRVFGRDSWGNPFRPEFVADPYVDDELIRADGPVVWKPLYQNWFVTGYDEVREILASPNATVSKQAEVLLDVSPYTKLSPRSRSFFENFLLLTDPPKHTRLRGLVNRAFTPRQVARLEERMSGIIDDLIADFSGDDVELMSEFATPFPSNVIAELLGLPPERWEWMQQTSLVVTDLLDPFRAFDVDVMERTISDFHDYIVEIASERRANPKDDLLTGLAQVEDGSDRLSENELVSIVGFILFAGHETTAGMFGNSIRALAEHPEQRAMVRANPDLWPNAVEELLRYDTSVRSDPRVAERAMELGGKKIKAGQNFVVLVGAANRDPRRFPDGHLLRLDRDDPSPISFGHGIHYCLGATLARAELRMGLTRLLEVLGDYTIDPAAIEWKQSITIRSPLKLPVTIGR